MVLKRDIIWFCGNSGIKMIGIRRDSMCLERDTMCI